MRSNRRNCKRPVGTVIGRLSGAELVGHEGGLPDRRRFGGEPGGGRDQGLCGLVAAGTDTLSRYGFDPYVPTGPPVTDSGQSPVLDRELTILGQPTYRPIHDKYGLTPARWNVLTEHHPLGQGHEIRIS
ncbi:hypothetical protein KCMC57_up58810 [Kitasatospora sp. CMC57]|uniref:Uncharacterized protein n=1 Tax=Kitasatospora sp. CMC57 TaxID=3231513 RepID=A0AB33K9Q5_9ACTN